MQTTKYKQHAWLSVVVNPPYPKHTTPLIHPPSPHPCRLSYCSTPQALALYVSARLGGAAHEEELSAAYAASSSSLKDPGRCVILLLGSLQLGTSRHRCLLFKALADDMGMSSMLMRGRGYGPAAARTAAAAAVGLGVLQGAGGSSSSSGSSSRRGRLPVQGGLDGLSAFVAVQVGGVSYHLDLLTAPGTLTPLREGLPVIPPGGLCLGGGKGVGGCGWGFGGGDTCCFTSLTVDAVHCVRVCVCVISGLLLVSYTAVGWLIQAHLLLLLLALTCCGQSTL